MKSYMKLWIQMMAALLFYVNPFFTPHPLYAGESQNPKTMTKMVIRDISHFVEKDSFHSKPKTLYRCGVQYARLEAPLNPEKNSQVLVVVKEPDIWMIDQVSKTGQVLKDAEGEFHVPVWSGVTIPPPLQGLEYGQEFIFFKKYKASKTGPVTLGTIACDRYHLIRSQYQVVLLARQGKEIPVELQILEDGKTIMDDFYDSYETALPFDPSLFRVPDGVKMADTPKAPASEWKEFQPDKARCSVLMPGQPKKDDGELEMWESSDSQGHSFNLSYYDIPKPVDDPDGFFKNVVKGIESTQSRVVRQRRFMYKGYPVCDFEVSSGNDKARTRVCLVRQRAYILTCGGDTQASTQEPGQIILEIKNPEEKFLNSLEFIHPELNRGK